MNRLTWLDPRDPAEKFPDTSEAWAQPNGLLAAGGDLSSQRLLNAYRHGIFPWFSDGDPILWWSPDPRAVLFPEQLKISRSLRKTLDKGVYDVTFDTAFEAVITACAAPRGGDHGTWITEPMIDAYCQLHHSGFAHAVEVWKEGELAGGLYGVSIGQVFFGESMFHRQRDASKVALVTLVQQLSQWGYRLIDCQTPSSHLDSLGASLISRSDFIGLLDSHCDHRNSCKWALHHSMHTT